MTAPERAEQDDGWAALLNRQHQAFAHLTPMQRALVDRYAMDLRASLATFGVDVDDPAQRRALIALGDLALERAHPHWNACAVGRAAWAHHSTVACALLTIDDLANQTTEEGTR
jgi:hypothetical protein